MINHLIMESASELIKSLLPLTITVRMLLRIMLTYDLPAGLISEARHKNFNASSYLSRLRCVGC